MGSYRGAARSSAVEGIFQTRSLALETTGNLEIPWQRDSRITHTKS